MVKNSQFCANIPRMKRILLLSLFSAVLLPALSLRAAAQVGGGHMLFGDFKVEDGGVGGPKPEAFHVILYTSGGRVIARQPITNNGRYRFFDVTNGDYDIVVELETQEVARVRVHLIDRQRTDIRQDIQLEWRDSFGGRNRTPSTVSAEDQYNRSSANAAQFAKAREAMKRNDYDQAISILNQITSSDPKDFIALTELATMQSKKDKPAEAEKNYLRALSERPGFFLALLNLGKVRLAQKNYEGAIEVLSRAVEKQPLSADANYLLGESYLGIKKGSKAVGYLYEAIKLDPAGKAEAHLRLAALYNAAGAKDKAAAEFEQFLAKKPDYPQKKDLEKYIQENKKR
jgi:tetratricopeptide (TPR) repeat protein